MMVGIVVLAIWVGMGFWYCLKKDIRDSDDIVAIVILWPVALILGILVEIGKVIGKLVGFINDNPRYRITRKGKEALDDESK